MCDAVSGVCLVGHCAIGQLVEHDVVDLIFKCAMHWLVDESVAARLADAGVYN